MYFVEVVAAAVAAKGQQATANSSASNQGVVKAWATYCWKVLRSHSEVRMARLVVVSAAQSRSWSC